MERCSIHPSERIQLYCRECERPVCNTCVTNRHTGHTFKKLTEVKGEIITKVGEAKDESARTKRKLEQRLKELQSEIDRQNESFSKNCQEIEKRKKELKRYVDKKLKKYEEECRNHHEKNISDIQKKCVHLKRDIKKLSQYETTLNRLKSTDKVSDLIRQFELPRAPVTHDIGDLEIPQPCKFVPGKHFPRQEMFGHVEEHPVEDHYKSIAQPTDKDGGAYACMTPSSRSSFSAPSESASEIETVYDRVGLLNATQQGTVATANIRRETSSYIVLSAKNDLCWVKYHNQNKIKLVNRIGKEIEELKSISDRISGVSCYQDDKLLVCLPEMKIIRQVDRYRSVDFISTGEFIPKCVCSFRFDDTMIFVILENPSSCHGPASCELVKYKKTVEEMRARKDQFGNDLFYSSDKISVNRTRNRMAVINNCGPSRTHLVILETKDLKLSWRYFGDGRAYDGHANIDPHLLQKDTNMCLTDVAFDNNQNIVIADRLSKTVKLLNQNMEPLSVLGTFNESPMALAMDNISLWIMFVSGNLSVVNHRVPSSSH
ncbi:uncharacterized protein LOC117337727 [Pecten maximus]|uniref:uncharacterized protein LOC117337727 n=1 Tax=Pecten maximus TaxID=6579 RepID=UPI0014586EA3|nr:uncharacterized protein LOC117337727 [Pecten maximus]